MSSFAPTKVPKMHECRKERKRRTYRKSNQRTHRTHTTKKHPEVSTNTPRSFANTTIAHSKLLMCIDAKFPHTPICTPKFRNAPKSKVSDYLIRPSKFPYTHEVREFLTIQRPQCTRPNTPRSLLGSLIASKIRYLSREIFTPWGLDRPPPAPSRTGGNPSVCVPKNA